MTNNLNKASIPQSEAIYKVDAKKANNIKKPEARKNIFSSFKKENLPLLKSKTYKMKIQRKNTGAIIKISLE